MNDQQKQMTKQAEAGRDLIKVKFKVDSFRSLQAGLMELAYELGDDSVARGFLVLAESPISLERVREDWQRSKTVLRPNIFERIHICLQEGDDYEGVPKELGSELQFELRKAVDAARRKTDAIRTDFGFIISKLLIHQWLVSGEPVTSEWLARTAGCSYPAVARALTSMGSLLHRGSDRRVALRWFPREEFARLMAIATGARSTVRFADISGQLRSVESHYSRLIKLNPEGVAFGGTLAAKYYFPDFDLVGTPRLDLCVHSPGKQPDLDFISELDPALKRVSDPLAPASLVVHAVHQADSLFKQRKGGLAWADPVECLFDLHEARLDSQASEFVAYLQKQAQSESKALVREKLET